MTRDKLVEELIAAVWAGFAPRYAADDVTRLYVREKFLPLIDRYATEYFAIIHQQAALMLPLVKAVVQRHRDFPSEGRSANFDGPYEYTVRIRLSSGTLEAAERWLVEQTKLGEA